MPANLGTESVTVQHPLTRCAGQAGWTIVSKEEATTLRHGESGMFFYDLLKAKLQALNAGVRGGREPCKYGVLTPLRNEGSLTHA